MAFCVVHVARMQAAQRPESGKNPGMDQTMNNQTQHGGCQCGAVRYEAEGESLGLFVCHCVECRKQSASAFGITLVMPRSGVHLTRGEPQFWSRIADSGNTVECAFCPNCGTRLWHQKAGDMETVRLKGGSLDEPVDLSGAVHIWISRKLPGVIVPEDATQFPEGPTK